MRIGVITCHRAFNYGAVLQTYALQKYLRNCKYEAEVIDYTPQYIRKSYNKNILKRIIRPVLRHHDFKKSNQVFGNFLREEVYLTEKRYYTYDELKENTPDFDVYITGSDQIWNCNIENGKDDAFFLRFTPKNREKMSYAASISMDEIPEEQKDRFRENLKDFDFISVREQTAIRLLEEIGIKNVERVLDPVYLLDIKDWNKIAQKSKLNLESDKYILAYGFKQQKDLYEYARKLANDRNCKIYSINTNFEDKFLDVDKYFYNATPYDFVNLVKNAQEVVTNSFHGLSFSIIYNKPVHQFKKSGTENSRMIDLLTEINLSDRLVVNNNLLTNKVDFLRTNDIIKELKNKSIDFLERCLGEKNG